MSKLSDVNSDWLAVILSFLTQFAATVTASLLLGFVNPRSLSPFHAAGVVALFVTFAASITLLALTKANKIGNWLHYILASFVGIILFSGIGFYLASYPQTPPLTQEEVALTEIARETNVASTRVMLVDGVTQTAKAEGTQQFQVLFQTAEAELRATHLWEEALLAVSKNATATKETGQGTAVAVANSTIAAQNTAQAVIIATEVAKAAAATAQSAVIATQAAAATETQIARLATPNPGIPRGICGKVKPPCTHHVVEHDTYTEMSLEYYGSYSEAGILINFNRNSNGTTRNLITGATLFVPAKDFLPPLPYPKCSETRSYPCLHIARVGDTFDIVSQEFYGSVSKSKFLMKNNELFGLTEMQIEMGYIPQNAPIVLPIPP
jgi:cell wall-associated NlpC family hydrolase